MHYTAQYQPTLATHPYVQHPYYIQYQQHPAARTSNHTHTPHNQPHHTHPYQVYQPTNHLQPAAAPYSMHYTAKYQPTLATHPYVQHPYYIQYQQHPAARTSNHTHTTHNQPRTVNTQPTYDTYQQRRDHALSLADVQSVATNRSHKRTLNDAMEGSADPSVPPKKRSREASHEASLEVEIIEAKRSVRCPITQCTMTHPVKSVSCNHVFERSAIMDYIDKKEEVMTANIECPVVGCCHCVTKSELVIDNEMVHLLKEDTKHSGDVLDWTDLTETESSDESDHDNDSNETSDWSHKSDHEESSDAEKEEQEYEETESDDEDEDIGDEWLPDEADWAEQYEDH
eukprot:1105908_1